MNEFKSDAKYTNFHIFVRVLITVIILSYLGYKLDLRELVSQLARTDPAWLILACVLVGLAFLAGSIRWWLLLKVQNITLAPTVVAALTLIGQFFNSFLLGAAGGDVVKAVYLLKYTPNQKSRAAFSVVMDRALGIFVLLCFAIVGLMLQFESLMQREDTKSMTHAVIAIFLLIAGSGLAIAFLPFQRMPRFLHQLWAQIPQRKIIEALIAAFRQHGSALRLTAEATVYSVLVQVLVFTAGYCIANAIGLDVTYQEIIIILAIVIGVISLPISVGGHGVREGMFVLMFSVFGIITVDSKTGLGQEPAVLFSVLFFATYLVWSIIGGVVYLTFRHSHKHEQQI